MTERLRCGWHRQRFLLVERGALRELSLGPKVRFGVPVRSGGEGVLRIGTGCMLGYAPAPRLGSGEILLQPRVAGAVIDIGAGVLFSNNVNLVAMERITIGDGCQIGDLVAIYDSDFHELSPATRNRSPGPSAPVSIGRNVWLGSRVLVLKGVSIGDNSVVGAGSVVTKSLPTNCVAAGVPARVIRSLE